MAESLAELSHFEVQIPEAGMPSTQPPMLSEETGIAGQCASATAALQQPPLSDGILAPMNSRPEMHCNAVLLCVQGQQCKMQPGWLSEGLLKAVQS